MCVVFLNFSLLPSGNLIGLGLLILKQYFSLCFSNSSFVEKEFWQYSQILGFIISVSILKSDKVLFECIDFNFTIEGIRELL